jgi:fructoselysine 6-kinase
VIEFAAVGDNCIDRFLPPVGDSLVGGNAVNVAVQLAMLGRRVHYLGAVGGDKAGLVVRSCLEAKGVGIARLITAPGLTTAWTDVATLPNGERQFLHEDFGACAGYAPAGDDIVFLRRLRHVHIGWLNDGGALRRDLAGCQVTVSQDLTVNAAPENLQPRGLDIAFCSASPETASAELQRLLGEGARLAVVTMGPAGSMADDGKTVEIAAAPALVPFDTTGAGDAFIAGFLDAYVAGRALAACLSHATERAGLACLHRGGFPQEPLPAAFTEL